MVPGIASAQPSRRGFVVAPLVGRRAELRVMREAVLEAKRGRGSLVGLCGEAGVGKTRLAAEILAAERGTCATLLGRAYAAEGAVPFGMWIDALGPALARSPDALRRLVGSRTILKRVFPGLDGSIADTDVQLGSFESSEQAKLTVFVAFRDLMHRLALERPLLVSFDDVHLADQASIELLHFVARSISTERTLVLATYRIGSPPEHALSRCLDSLRRHELFVELALPPLDATETREFVVNATDVHPSGSAIAQLHARTGGNPLFLQEVLRANQRDVSFDRVPESIAHVVHERLAFLGPEAHALLPLAAVAGTAASLALLQSVAELDEDSLLAGIDELLHHRFLSERVERGKLRYSFTHPLFREVVYDELSATRRASLHEAIGHALAGSAIGEPVEAAELAYHLGRAISPLTRRTALPHMIAAADHALALFANRDALDYLERADAVLDERDAPKLRVAVLHKLGRALIRLGRFRAAIEVWTRALVHAGDAEERAALHRSIGSACWDLGEEERALKHFDEGLRPLGDACDSVEAVRLWQDLAQARQRLGDPERSIAENLRSVAIAERLDKPELAARGFVGLLTTYAVQGDMARAAEYGNRAVALATDRSMAPVAWLAHATLGALLRHRAAHDESARHLNESLRIADAIGAPALASWPLAALSELERMRGELPAALEFGRRAVEIDRAYEQHGLLPRSLAFAAIARRLLGERARAANDVAEARELMRALRKHELRIWTAVAGAEAFLAYLDGDFEATGALSGALIEHLESHGAPALYLLQPFALPLHIEAAIRGGNARGVEAVLGRLRTLAARWCHAPAQAAYYHLSALREGHIGRPGPAAFDAGAEAYAALGLRTAHAGALVDKCEHLLDLGERDRALSVLADGGRIAIETRAQPLIDAFAAIRAAAGVKAAMPRRPSGPLTDRETQVAQLAARGMTNKQIATELSISLLTAETHVRNILRKCELRSRTQLAEQVAEAP
jgi:DNA-binding CsgD family transcriptional regulator/tetratricopeptide (TPR) repeat protein